MRHTTNVSVLILCLVLTCLGVFAAQVKKQTSLKRAAVKTAAPSKASTVAKKSSRNVIAVRKTTLTSSRTRRKRRSYSPWSEPTFADSTIGDSVDGEDPVVRKAAVEALGPYNGSVVAVDPQTGRVMTMVNQKLALKSGFQPCSTIKVPVAMAGLIEGIVERDTLIRLYGRKRMNLTDALARSDNVYFSHLGTKLGFERVSYYARLFGLGEKAGLNIDGEHPGAFPERAPANGGVGMLSSFGEGISLTPLQLAAMLSAIANGGTLYYLQYPRSEAETESFIPRVKRRLDIEPWVPDIKPGMMGAVEYGTARRAAYDPSAPVLGKTGTCTENRTHLGWFGSFNDFGRNKLVVVVLLTGGRGVSGPTAAEIAGGVYRRLSEKDFFAAARTISPAALVGTHSCCAQ